MHAENQHDMLLTLITQERARSVFEDMRNDLQVETFETTGGWFERFKKQLWLPNIKMSWEAAGAVTLATNEYPAELKKLAATNLSRYLMLKRLAWSVFLFFSYLCMKISLFC